MKSESRLLTQDLLKKLLEETYKKGSESPSVTSKQLVEEIANYLKPFVKA